MNNDLKRPSRPGASAGFPDSATPSPVDNQPFRSPESGAMAKPVSAESRLKQDGVALKDKAMSRLANEANLRKDGVSKQLKSVSSALSAAEDELAKPGSDTPEWLTSGLHQVVTSVEDFANRVQNKDSTELIGEVRSFARQNPATFLVACAAAGFAAARLFKAGEPDAMSRQSNAPQPYGTSQTGMGGTL